MAVAPSEADAVSARLRAAAFALAFVMASAAPADAQLPTARHPDQLMSEAHSLYDAGRYKEAAASFERAIQLGVARPHEAALSVARSYDRLGNDKQAERWIEIAALLACAGHDDAHDAARPLPASIHAPDRDALISRLEEVSWRMQSTGTPTGRCPSSASSTTFTS